MFKIIKPTNTQEELKLIGILKNTLPDSFNVELAKEEDGEYKIYLEDREIGQRGKYSSGLTYVHSIETLNAQFEGDLCTPIETPEWVDGRRGFSTILYKGVFCYNYEKLTGDCINAFDYTAPKPTHSLFKVNWGGANSPSRGFITPASFEDNLVYLKRAESNGKGRGLTYAIISNKLLDELEEVQVEMVV